MAWLINTNIAHKVKIKYYNKRITTLTIGNTTIIGAYMPSSPKDELEYGITIGKLNNILIMEAQEKRRCLIVGDLNGDIWRCQKFSPGHITSLELYHEIKTRLKKKEQTRHYGETMD
jgi:exonuclease III